MIYFDIIAKRLFSLRDRFLLYFFKHKEQIRKILYLYSHFMMIIGAILLGFLVSVLFLYLIIKALLYSVFYLPLGLLIFIIFAPYIIDLLSRGLYNYPFFAMTFFQKDRFKLNKINAFLYKYAKFCFFFGAFLTFLSISICFMTLVHMLIFDELFCSFNAYIGFLIIIMIFIPVALELFSYSWHNKSFYL